MAQFLENAPIITIYQVLQLFLNETRWTFSRVKLVFEFDFETSWSLGPLDPGTLGLQDFGTSSLLHQLLIPPPMSSYFLLTYIPLLLPTSYFLLPLVCFGLVWGGGGCQLTMVLVVG